ncbi:MAG TPA: hypothetical protein VNT58_07205 [Gaiellaceae bacterium]|nr:hypothetical protein [Gaiellaceae bacterium]
MEQVSRVELNDRRLDDAGREAARDAAVAFYCECMSPECNDAVVLRASELRALRADGEAPVSIGHAPLERRPVLRTVSRRYAVVAAA